MRFPAPSRKAGYSLPEIMVTIAVIGIMAAIALASFGNVTDGAKLAQAQSITAKLNAAVKSFDQTNWDMPTAADDTATTDELKVLRSLQYKPAASLGSFNSAAPFYSPNWNPTASNSTQDYRVMWNGFNFQLLTPGTVGQGLKLLFDGSDQSSPYVFASNYQIEGTR